MRVLNQILLLIKKNWLVGKYHYYFKGRKFREAGKSRNCADLSFAIFTFWSKFMEKTFQISSFLIAIAFANASGISLRPGHNSHQAEILYRSYLDYTELPKPHRHHKGENFFSRPFLSHPGNSTPRVKKFSKFQNSL